jgi:murein DD-endopeptidase MepM/ murein hydrolase activator NlpD
VPTGRHSLPSDEPAARNAAGSVGAPEPQSSPAVEGSSTPRIARSTPIQVATPAGRRARPARLAAEAPVAPETAPAAPAPVPEVVAEVRPRARRALADAAATAAPTTGTGRRRKPPAETVASPTPDVPATPAAVPTGTGRRRKPPVDAVPAEVVAVEAPPVAPGTGRRRKPPVDAAPAEVVEATPLPTEVVEAVVTPGTGRRRRPTAEQQSAEIGLAPQPEVAQPEAAKPQPAQPAASEDDEAPLAPVVPITAGRRSHGSHGTRRRPRRAVAVPGAPAVIAGTAAVAVAAVGALGAAGSGTAGLGNTDLARASALGISAPGLANSPQQIAERDAARASRERARTALAKRQKEAAALKAKQIAAAKALKLAKERAARLARLAKSYRMPVQGFRVTAGYGAHGLWSSSHTGTDFACPYGTVIRAIGSGRIVSAGWDGAYGWKTVQILNDGTEIWYAHQSKMLVKSGYVNAGDPIGRVGTTGRTTGPHLHLEVRIDGKPINPIPWMRARGIIR